ncbi:hypothetical protein EON62_03620, partial [archaeon]
MQTATATMRPRKEDAAAAAGKSDRPPYNPNTGDLSLHPPHIPPYVSEPLPGTAVDRLRASGRLRAGKGAAGAKDEAGAQPVWRDAVAPATVTRSSSSV